MKRSCTLFGLMDRIKLSLDHSFAAEVWNGICSVAFEAHNVRVIFKVINFLVVFQQLSEARWRCFNRAAFGTCLLSSLSLCSVSIHLIIAPSCLVMCSEGC